VSEDLVFLAIDGQPGVQSLTTLFAGFHAQVSQQSLPDGVRPVAWR
jgi:hypothetical protein